MSQNKNFAYRVQEREELTRTRRAIVQ